jgi:23S rRNA pseudouridine1911/1915/1917 synthase
MVQATIAIAAEQAGQTLAAVLRKQLPGQSWSQVRCLIASRHVKVNGDLCLDPARRLREGESVEIMARPGPMPATAESIVVRHIDDQVVVVEKPSGMNTVRHPAERGWPESRKTLSPTLHDLVSKIVARRGEKPGARVRIVHRLDKETSGLVVFARTPAAESALGKQFHAHTVHRRYLAIVPGTMKSGTIRSRLVRDRGDGRRGSTANPHLGKEAVTHFEVIEKLPGHTLLACRLETGRTHQIRIHLAEAGHPVCGERVYHRGTPGADAPRSTGGADAPRSDIGAPRLALHAAELGFVHPASGKSLRWEMPLPADLQQFLDRLRK